MNTHPLSTKQRLKQGLFTLLALLVLFLLFHWDETGRGRFYEMAGGLAIFLYGMAQMTRALELLAGENLRRYFEVVTGNRVVALFTGLGVTALIQSSSACTVMVIGFVNAGMMTLSQAAGVIIGSNIGTTVTGQLIAFKISKFSLPIIALGTCFYFLSKAKKRRMFGQVLIGFGLLFIGMDLMSHVAAPLKKDPAVQQWLALISSNPLMGVLVGTVFTVILQSSSATVAITMTMAGAGLIDYRTAVALILGENIGTTITAQLAALPAGRAAKRAAWIHTMFNAFGVLIALLVFPAYLAAIDLVSGDADIMRRVANAHTLFNVANSLIFLVLLTPLVRSCEWILPLTATEKERGRSYLDKTLLTVPEVAVEAVARECVRMARMSLQAVEEALAVLETYNEKRAAAVVEQEDLVDGVEYEIIRYCLLIEEKELTKEDTQLVNRFIAFAHNLERVTDECENTVRILEDKEERKIAFSESAREEMKRLALTVRGMVDQAIDGFLAGNLAAARSVLNAERAVTEMVHQLREGHLNRLCGGECNYAVGHFFLDLVERLEKMGDRCRNIACHALELHEGNERAA